MTGPARSRKRLTWRKLDDVERRAYGVLVASFSGRDAMDDTWKQNVELRGVQSFANAFSPTKLATRMARASFHSIRAAAARFNLTDADLLFDETTSHGRRIRLFRPTYSAYWYFFQDLVEAYDCGRVDWATFPKPPWRIDFARPEADEAILAKLNAQRDRGEELDLSVIGA